MSEYYRIRRVVEKAHGTDLEDCLLHEVPITAFGTAYSWKEDESVTSNNSLYPVLKLSMNIPNVLEGNYRADWCYEWNRSSTRSIYNAIITLDKSDSIGVIANRKVLYDDIDFNVVGSYTDDYEGKIMPDNFIDANVFEVKWLKDKGK